KVLMITEAAGGGAGRHVLDLAEGLLARGHDVHLIYSPRRLDRFFRERLDRARPLRRLCLPMRRGPHPVDVAALWSIRRYLRACGPFDIIHGHSAKGGALARLAGLGTRTPVLYTLHGYVAMDPGLARRKRLFYHLLEWVLSRASERIIAVSPEERRSCVRGGLGHARVVLIPNGIAPIAYPPRPEARRGLGLAEDCLVAGFVGRLVDQKAPDVMIRALADVAPAASRLRLAVVGSGPLEGPLRDLAGRLGVADRVLWLGERDSTGVLPAFDLFVLPSRKEGLPYVVLEAMAAGLPILATAAAGVELLVRPGHNGLIVPPDRPDLLAAALEELISDPPGLRRRGRNARERAAQFTAEGMVDRTIAEYRSCLDRGGRGGVRTPPPRAEPPPWPRDGQAPAPGAPARPGPRSGRPGDVPTSTRAGPSPTRDQPIGPVTPSPTPYRCGASTMASKPRSAELHPGPGFRVRLDFTRLDPALMGQFRGFATPDISDLLNRLYAMDPGIRCLTGPHHRLCGPACTVKVFPGDNLMVHKALDVARPGDIVVVDAGRSMQNAVLGDLISTKARHRRIAGFVIDGLVRDLPSILPLDFPIFARGTTPIGPLHRGPGEINYPICCGGTVINPGDLIVADAAGVVVVPKEIAAELLERLTLHREANEAYFEAVHRGEFSNQWVDHALADQGCPIIGPDGRRDGAAGPPYSPVDGARAVALAGPLTPVQDVL
ncbi:MAG: glycosyltransferase, partial [Planctomycetaceae bacterium]